MKNFGMRRLFDVDSSGGSSTVTAPVDTSTSTPATDPSTTDVKDTPATKSDTDAANRYAISRAREAEAAKWQKKYDDLVAQGKAKKPDFNDETDPDGSKEVEYLAEQKAEAALNRKLEELGLTDKIENIQRERQQDEFFKKVDTASESFKALGIEVNKDAIKQSLLTLETQGVTPEQLILLAHGKELLAKMTPAPQGFTPGKGQPAQQQREAPKSNSEIFDRIYAEEGITWNGGRK